MVAAISSQDSSKNPLDRTASSTNRLAADSASIVRASDAPAC